MAIEITLGSEVKWIQNSGEVANYLAPPFFQIVPMVKLQALSTIESAREFNPLKE
jgi:hypothetical protein